MQYDYFSFSHFVFGSPIFSHCPCLVESSYSPTYFPPGRDRPGSWLCLGIAGHFVELVDVYRADCKALSFLLLGVKSDSQFA